MPGHWNYNAENHLPTHTLTHYTKAGGEDFAVLVLWLHEPNYQFQCVFSPCVCVNASVRVCRQVRQQTLTVRFHAPQAVPQTDTLCLGVEEMIGRAAPPGSFRKHNEEPIVNEPLATDYHTSSPHLLVVT